MRRALLFALLLSPALFAAEDWGSLQFLIGEWSGQGAGEPGAGTGSFSFLPDLQGGILVRKSFAEYPASGGKPAYRHDDLLIVYREGPARQLRAIYFDNEGHTIRYSVEASANRAVFTSDSAQSAPRYRMTYRAMAPDELAFTFEMAAPGQDLAPYINATLRRRKPGAAR